MTIHWNWGGKHFWKEKALFYSILFQILKFQFWLVNNCSKLEGRILSSHIWQKCVICCQKTWTGCKVKLKFFTEANYLLLKKNMSKPKAPNIVKMGYEIYKYLSNIFIISKYWVCLSEAGVQLVHNFIHILRAFFVNLAAAAADCVQLVPKFYSKVKLCSWQSPNISV